MKDLNLINEKSLPKDEDFLWRYVDIHKFLNLINEKRIRFTRMDQFEDALEGVPYESLRVFIDDEKPLLKLSNIILDYDSSKNHLGLRTRLDDIIDIQTTQFVSCWFNEKRESMAMWNLYSNSDGVAIKIPFGKLKNGLIPEIDETEIDEYFCGKVNYQNFTNMNPEATDRLSVQKKVSLRKDVSFSHEKEIRFVVKLLKSNKTKLGISSKSLDLINLDLNVICHPKMAEWKKSNIKQALKKAKLNSSFFESEIKLRF